MMPRDSMSVDDWRSWKRASLVTFLDTIDRKPWQWSSCDCTMMVADWIKELTGTDPAREIRGHYHSPEEAIALARAHGGFTAWVARTLDAFGLPRALEEEPGDVAVVIADKLQLPTVAGVMAIRSGELWVVKTPRGLIGQKFAPVIAWRL